MPSDLIVICNVQPLGPNYGDPNSFYFGINISVATSDTDWQFSDDWLKPWRWKWSATDVKVTDDHSVYHDVTATPISCKATFPVDSIENTLDAYFNFLKKDPVQIKWDEKQRVLNFTSGSDDATGATLKAFWHAMLLDVATSPAPIRSLLNLSKVFRIPLTGNGKQRLIAGIAFDDKTRIVACPEFTIANQPLLKKQGNPSFNQDTYQWDFQTAAGAPQIRARINDASVRVPPKCKSSYIDLRSQWILRPETSSATFDDDWLARETGSRSLRIFHSGFWKSFGIWGPKSNPLFPAIPSGSSGGVICL
jgi:hypothetical protein